MIRDLRELAKPRISALVALTAALGWTLAGGVAGWRLAAMLAGVCLASSACGALNQYLERVEDGIMKRTRSRPLPTGRLAPAQALRFGLAAAVAGPLLVWASAGPLAAGLTLATVLLYVLGYTPLKKVTPQTTWIGAAAGAMPPLIGWAGAAGTLDARAWALFGIQFLWQIPHFLALFWMHREDYAAAGFKVMPVVHPDGGTTAVQIALHSFTLLPATLLPALVGLARPSYVVPAMLVATTFLAVGLRASWTLSHADARRLFLASLVYLPVIFGMLLIGGV